MSTFTANDCSPYMGKVCGNGQCATFVKEVTGAPHAGEWKQGDPIRGNTSITPGTAIATFQDGKYQSRTNGDSHAAIYMSQDSDGIHVVDQWTHQPVHERVIHWRGGNGRPDNDGDAFSVVIAGESIVGDSGEVISFLERMKSTVVEHPYVTAGAGIGVLLLLRHLLSGRR